MNSGHILLSREEFNNLVNKSEIVKRDIIINSLKDKILKMCEFDCYMDTKEQPYEGYCDDCPLAPHRNIDIVQYADETCKYTGYAILSSKAISVNNNCEN